MFSEIQVQKTYEGKVGPEQWRQSLNFYTSKYHLNSASISKWDYNREDSGNFMVFCSDTIRSNRALCRILALRDHSPSEVAFSPSLSLSPGEMPTMFLFSFFLLISNCFNSETPVSYFSNLFPHHL